MTTTLKEKLTASREGLKQYQQERTILAVTEMLCEIMEQENITRAELASRLGKSKGFISQVLDGSANMTLRTLADILTELDKQLEPSYTALATQKQQHESKATVISLPIPNSRLSKAWPEPTIAVESPLACPEGVGDVRLAS